MDKFNKGDRVERIEIDNSPISGDYVRVGDRGTILQDYNNIRPYGLVSVQWDHLGTPQDNIPRYLKLIDPVNKYTDKVLEEVPTKYKIRNNTYTINTRHSVTVAPYDFMNVSLKFDDNRFWSETSLREASKLFEALADGLKKVKEQ